ncbi:MAG TPA: methyltransferase [Caulobacteraceae bacterium]|jgi:protein-S-isoprenylcysteine O-methyltransferase Ste14|nr:methyltransferase [Caulobacteraceae bacterium]
MDLAEQPLAATAPASVTNGRLLTLLDLIEKVFVLCLFALMASRVYQSVGSGGSWLNYLQLSAEALAVVLILLRRRARELSLRPMDWALAVGATAAPLLVRPMAHSASLAPIGVCAGLMLSGLLFQVVAKLTLRFSFGMAPANRGLKVGGPYRIVRHPIYAAYLIGQLGFFLLNPSLYNAAVYGVGLGLQIFRIAAEERVLAHDEGFAGFRAATPYRLIPGVY